MTFFKVSIISTLFLLSTLIPNTVISKEFDISKLNYQAQKTIALDHQLNLLSLQKDLLRFDTQLETKNLSSDLTKTRWISIAQKFQKYGVEFTPNNLFIIPLSSDFHNHNINLSFQKESINTEIKLIKEILNDLDEK
jgi:hypothetical protein